MLGVDWRVPSNKYIIHLNFCAVSFIHIRDLINQLEYAKAFEEMEKAGFTSSEFYRLRKEFKTGVYKHDADYIDRLQVLLQTFFPKPKPTPYKHQHYAPANQQENFLLQRIEALVREDHLEAALKLMRENIHLGDKQLKNSLLGLSGQLASLTRRSHDGLITESEANVQRNKLRQSILYFAGQIPADTTITIDGRPEVAMDHFYLPSGRRLEKIIGGKDTLLQVSWLLKGIKASRSVCRVLLPSGEHGTGFLLEGGYLMTNNHVIPNAEVAAKAQIEFNYEEDEYGNARKIARYDLDATSLKVSSFVRLDYSYVRVKDNAANPLQQWGYLEVDTFSEPQKGAPTFIIQHPDGKRKQIALYDNEILSVWNDLIFYTTGTREGSSGSPVFNADWKVIALHRAGMNEEDGGLQIDADGTYASANEGVLMSTIYRDLGKLKP